MQSPLRLRMLAACGTVALALGVAGCTAPAPAPSATGIQSPSASASAEWGAYGSKDDACSAVAGDVLTLALVPKNLALADPGGGVDDIDNTISEAADAAPPAIAPNYLQLAAIVRSFGSEVAEWSATVEQLTSTPTPTPGDAGTSSSPTPRPSVLPKLPERPAFVDTAYDAQLDRIKAWLSDTCG